jgi:hypothetical protein
LAVTLMGLSKKITEAFGNPLVWILIAALAFASYGNYRRAQIVAHLCALTSPHDVTVAAATTPARNSTASVTGAKGKHCTIA